MCATAALVLAAGPAFAHAKLLSEVPAAEDAAAGTTSTTSVTELRLAFSEALSAAFSKATVTDATGTAVAGTAVALDPKDERILVVIFPAALAKGKYVVDWTAVAGDGHKTNGTYTVNVQ